MQSREKKIKSEQMERKKRREKNRMNIEKRALKIHLKRNISSLSNEVAGSMSAFKLPKQTAGHAAKAHACWRALPAPLLQDHSSPPLLTLTARQRPVLNATEVSSCQSALWPRPIH